MKNDSLHNLLVRIGNGDPAAYDILYLKMREPLCRKVLGMPGYPLSREDAEDAVQNAFIAIRRYAAGYTGRHSEASAHKWINTIVAHEASRMAKAKENLNISLDDQDGFDEFRENNRAVPERNLYKGDLKWEGDHSVEDRADRAFLLEKVLEGAQKCLTNDEMQVLVLRFVYEYKLEEIGSVIGKTKVRAKQIIDGLIEKIRRTIGVDLTRFDRQ